MSILVSCNCGKRLKAPDTAAGKRVRCPGCQAVISVPQPAPSETEGFLELDDEAGVPPSAPAKKCPSCGNALAAEAIICVNCGLDLRTGRPVGEKAPPAKKRRFKGSPGAWKTVRMGLTLFYGGLLTIVGAFLGVIIAAISAIAGAPAGMMLVVLVLAGFALFIAWVLMLIGEFMCLAAPSSGAKGLAIGAVVCLTLSLIIAVLLGIFQVTQRQAGLQPLQAPVLAGFSNLIGLVSNILFLLFLRAVATYFRIHALASSVIKFMIFTICFLVGIVGSAIILPFLAQILPRVGMMRNVVALLWFLAFIGSLVILWVWYIRLVRETRDAIPE